MNYLIDTGAGKKHNQKAPENVFDKKKLSNELTKLCPKAYIYIERERVNKRRMN